MAHSVVYVNRYDRFALAAGIGRVTHLGDIMTKTALIVGAGSGISASFARLLAKDGYRIALASEAHKPGRRDQGYDACLRCG
jgi:hypothetical protein